MFAILCGFVVVFYVALLSGGLKGLKGSAKEEENQ